MSELPCSSRVRIGLGAWAGLLLALGAVACKKGESRHPEIDLRGWSLDDIEAELDRNGQQLASAGILVAQATPGATASPSGYDAPAPEVAPSAEEDDTDLHADDGEALDDGGAGGDAPTAFEPEPEPTPATMPVEREEASVAYAPEADESPREGRSSRRRVRSTSSRKREPTRCDRVCDLADATCDLEVQICTLAEEHADDPRYASACLRAEEQCEAAADACNACED